MGFINHQSYDFPGGVGRILGEWSLSKDGQYLHLFQASRDANVSQPEKQDGELTVSSEPFFSHPFGRWKVLTISQKDNSRNGEFRLRIRSWFPGMVLQREFMMKIMETWMMIPDSNFWRILVQHVLVTYKMWSSPDGGSQKCHISKVLSLYKTSCFRISWNFICLLSPNQHLKAIWMLCPWAWYSEFILLHTPSSYISFSSLVLCFNFEYIIYPGTYPK